MFRRHRDQEFDQEIRAHIDLEIQRLIEDGMDPREARAAAIRSFGNVLASKERFYESRHWMWLDRLRQDTRYALRGLRRRPGFTLLVILTLALGVGANTATFSVLNAVQWTKLPVDDPGRLYQLGWDASPDGFARSYIGSGVPLPEGGRFNDPYAYPAYVELARSATLFDSVVATMPVTLDVDTESELQVVPGELVSGNYFETLGLSMAFGRPLTPDDDRPGAAVTVVISDRFWRTAFRADADAVGQTVTIDQTAAVIVGVLPKGFFGIDPRRAPDVMVPIAAHDVATGRPGVLEDPFAWHFQVFGRLATGVTVEEARREAERILGNFVDASNPPADYVRPRILLQSAAYGLDGLRQAVSTTVLVLMAGVGLILAIACLNLASLMTGRALARRGEIQTRLALGAGRARIAQQLLTESFVVAGVGGALGIGWAYLGGPVMLAAINRDPRTPFGIDPQPEPSVLLLAVGLTMATGLALGIAPAASAVRMGVARDQPGRTRRFHGLVASQVAIAVVLLSGSVVFVETLANIRSDPLGFRPDGVLTFRLNLERAGGGSLPLAFGQELLDRIESLPGVQRATLSLSGTMTDYESGTEVWTSGFAPETASARGSRLQNVAPGFFETMDIPVLAGRDVAWRDVRSESRVALVSVSLARHLFGDANAIGRRIGFRGPGSEGQIEVIGVVGDAKYNGIRDTPPRTVYLPLPAETSREVFGAVRSGGDPADLTPAIREAVTEMDSRVPVFEVRTQTELINRKLYRERIRATGAAIFGVVAMVLACVGIAGTIGYAVTRRTSEIGIRMALGARPSHVVRTVLRGVLTAVTAGVAAGATLTLASARLVDHMLFGVSASDPKVLLWSAGIFALSAVIAASIPARHAARVDPVVALRHESEDV